MELNVFLKIKVQFINLLFQDQCGIKIIFVRFITGKGEVQELLCATGTVLFHKYECCSMWV